VHGNKLREGVQSLIRYAQQQFSEKEHPTIERIQLDQRPLRQFYMPMCAPLRELSSPPWHGAIETSYAFEKENRYIRRWLAAGRGRMPRLQHVKLSFGIPKWSHSRSNCSVGGYSRGPLLERSLPRTLQVEASVSSSESPNSFIRSRAHWEHVPHYGCLDSIYDLQCADQRNRFAQELGIDVNLVHFLLGSADDPQWTADNWEKIVVKGARNCLNRLRAKTSP
jgi:hypothetical protein